MFLFWDGLFFGGGFLKWWCFQIMYAWARDAPALHLPEDVGFKVGGDSPVRYLVLQVHYSNVDKFKGKCRIPLQNRPRVLFVNGDITSFVCRWIDGWFGIVPALHWEKVSTVVGFMRLCRRKKYVERLCFSRPVEIRYSSISWRILRKKS